MILLEVVGTVLLLAGLYLGLQSLDQRWQRSRRAELTRRGVFCIVDEQHSGLLRKLDQLAAQSHIDLNTVVAFQDAVDQYCAGPANKRNIAVVLHSRGGDVGAAEAIVQRIMQAREDGYVVEAYVPHYAYSAGCFIAMACDRIHMSPSAVLGPTDAQLSSGYGAPQQSIGSICKTVRWQLENCPDKIKPKWYANYLDAQSTQKRQLKSINQWVERGYYSAAVGERLHAELFSGDLNHDQSIDCAWAEALGLHIAVCPEMPPFVARTLALHHAKRQ